MTNQRLYDQITQSDPSGRVKVVHANVANVVLQRIPFYCLKDTEELISYSYTEWCWRFGGDVVVKQLVEETIRDAALRRHISRNLVNEVIGDIQRRTYIDRSRFNSEPNKLPLRNGILDLDTLQLHPHSSDFLCTYVLPIEYDPNADCQLIKKFFRGIVAPEDVPVLEEVFGWFLDLYSYKLQRIVVMVGGGANGKSTYLQLCERFLGKDNCSSVPMDDVIDSRFSTAELYGKLANICAELPVATTKSIEKFKKLTGGDTIKAERKFQHPFQFQNHAKMVYAGNAFPEMPASEDNLAVWRRWVYIVFPNTFLGNDANTNLIEEISTTSELSGLLNLALEGKKRLSKSSDFSPKESLPAEERIEKVREKTHIISNPVEVFIEKRCLVHPNAEVFKQELYVAFNKFCANHRMPPMSTTRFGIELKKLNLPINAKQVGTKEKWVGIGIR